MAPFAFENQIQIQILAAASGAKQRVVAASFCQHFGARMGLSIWALAVFALLAFAGRSGAEIVGCGGFVEVNHFASAIYISFFSICFDY